MQEGPENWLLHSLSELCLQAIAWPIWGVLASLFACLYCPKVVVVSAVSVWHQAFHRTADDLQQCLGTRNQASQNLGHVYRPRCAQYYKRQHDTQAAAQAWKLQWHWWGTSCFAVWPASNLAPALIWSNGWQFCCKLYHKTDCDGFSCSQLDQTLNELRQVPVLLVQAGVTSAQHQSGVSLDLLDPLCNCMGSTPPFWPCKLDWADVPTGVIKCWCPCIRPVVQLWVLVDRSTCILGAAISAGAGKVSTSSHLSCTLLWPGLLFIAAISSAINWATASGLPAAELPHSCFKQPCISVSMSPIAGLTSVSACLFAFTRTIAKTVKDPLATLLLTLRCSSPLSLKKYLLFCRSMQHACKIAFECLVVSQKSNTRVWTMWSVNDASAAHSNRILEFTCSPKSNIGV